jgi:hypothetical protein
MDEIAGALIQAIADAARQRQAQRQAQLGADKITVPGSGQPQASLIRPTSAQQQAKRAASSRTRPAAPPARVQPAPAVDPDEWRLTELGPDPMAVSADQHPALVHARHLRGLLEAFGDRHRLLGGLIMLEVLRPPLALRPFDER